MTIHLADNIGCITVMFTIDIQNGVQASVAMQVQFGFRGRYSPSRATPLNRRFT